jgi:glycosyltransferase involved in cell wall biosynthesis
MNILMVTNTFSPQVGGVARSVQGFSDEFRRRGHRVLVIAPAYEEMPADEMDVVRIPALPHFSGSDFSMPMPVPGRVAAAVRAFAPHIVHSHHPYLLGDTALRVAARNGLPVAFTHHTLYENYLHHVSVDSPRRRRFVLDLATGYCNLCNAVIAPSESVAGLLAERGVQVPVEVIPTGVDFPFFANGDGSAFRARQGIPHETFLLGHLGRLSREKNLGFLAEAVAGFLQVHPGAHFLLAGEGPALAEILQILERAGVAGRLHYTGVLRRQELAAAYHAMDVFVFASLTETQGMVLTEAMAAGVPVVAVDGSGVREVVRDGVNGRLLPRTDAGEFAAALALVAGLPPESRRQLREGALQTAEHFSMTGTATRTLNLYQVMIDAGRQRRHGETNSWSLAQLRILEEWKILRNISHAVCDAVRSPPDADTG